MCDLQFRRQGLNSSCSVSCQSTTSPPFNPKLLTFGDVSDAWEVPASDLRSRGGPDGEACTQRARSFGCRHLTAGAGTPRRSKVAGQGVWRAPAARTGLGANMATHSSGATKLISLAPPSVYPLICCFDSGCNTSGWGARGGRAAFGVRRWAGGIRNLGCISGCTVSLVAQKLPCHRGTPTGHVRHRLVNHRYIQTRPLMRAPSFTPLTERRRVLCLVRGLILGLLTLLSNRTSADASVPRLAGFSLIT